MAYYKGVARTVQARLDDETQTLLERLRRQTGLGESELVRRGLRLLATDTGVRRRRAVVGVGRFASGHPDLGSNKRHLDGFGRR